METGMVAATLSSSAADIERKWLDQLAYEDPGTAAMAAGKSFSGTKKVSGVSGIYGLSQTAEKEWLSMIGSRA